MSDAFDARASSASAAPPSRFLLCYSRALADRLAYLELEVEGKAQDGWSRLTDAELEAAGGDEASGCFAVPLDAGAGRAIVASGGAKVAAYASFARALAPRPASVAQGEPQHVLFADAALRAVSPYRVEQQTIEAVLPLSSPSGAGSSSSSSKQPLSFFPGGPVGVLRPASSSSSSSGGTVKFSPAGATAPWAALSAKVRAEDGGGDTAKGEGASSSSSPSPALSVHFAIDEPLVRGLRVVRDVEVSHWGNVYFEETYLVRNDGPALEGEFSRRRYGDRSAYTSYMFENLRARLPAGSRWIYYRDAIGNVSTSAVHRLPKGASFSSLGLGGSAGKKGGGADEGGGVVVDLGMRYPMVGGWQADFVLGYSLPLASVVSRVSGTGMGGRMRLRLSLPPPFEGMYADELEVRVALPEGAKSIAHGAPSAPNAKASLERKRAYLDAPWGPGRPVLALRLRDAVPDHASARLTVEYTVGALDLARKPLLLVGCYAAVFAALALLNRADLRIAPAGAVPGAGAGKAKAKAA